ncbi:MAG: hypothetical protein NTW86_33045, partial [Candidatus Sumerlaeota bacterium]|nr:hypothetical protein [Candidatus Sumerlaeota bacterium]
MSDRTILILSHLGALLVVGFLLYRPVLQNDFVFDDMTNIVQNQALQQRDFLQGLFSREYAQAWAGPDYYAPIAALSYYLDTRWHAVGGRLSSAGVHATNLVLCLAICVMAYGVFLAVAGRPGFSLVGALFFLAHPMHAENVNYVSSRPELLAALFTLGAMLASWLPSRALWARALQFFAVLFCTLFATLSGAAGLAAPLVLLAADWARIRRLRQPGAGQAAWRDRAWRAYAPMAAAFLLFVALRLALFGSLLSVQIYDPFFGDLTRAQRIWTWFQVLLRYVSLSVFPY